jgi:hypothetical protein
MGQQDSACTAPPHVLRVAVEELPTVDVVLRFPRVAVPNGPYWALAYFALLEAVLPLNLPRLDARQEVHRDLLHPLRQRHILCHILTEGGKVTDSASLKMAASESSAAASST